MCSQFLKIGGNVSKFEGFWHTVTTDKYILSLIKGVKVPFEGQPPVQVNLPRELRMTTEEMNFVDEHLNQLIVQGFVKKLDHHIADGWVSNIFLVPKKQGGFRMILNLKELNKHVRYTKFKMDHIDQVIKMIRPADKISSLDLVQAYGHLKIFPTHEKYFQFTWRGHSIVT